LLEEVGGVQLGNGVLEIEAFEHDAHVVREPVDVIPNVGAELAGVDFEEAVRSFVQGEVQRLGDLFEVTKDTTGKIPRSKVGDFVATLSAETAAPGSRIVFESKENKCYSVKGALDELKTARQNRDAQAGIFVCSHATAPADLEPLSRWGEDILAVWNAEDPASDVYLKAAISLARLMLVQQSSASTQTTACIAEMDAAVEALTRDIGLLDDITRMAQTVKNSGENIVTKAESLRKNVDKQLETLRDQVAALKSGR
jgi:hypothetical protein